MPEACFLCLDSSEYMRNGDQFPTRLIAEQEAANLVVNAKIQVNAENTVGFLVTGGNACTVFETLTSDVDRVMASIAKITIAGPTCHFAHGMLIASLALTHRTNPRAEKRIVVFVGSPLRETDAELDALARRLRRDDVAVDVVGFGVDANVPRLTSFVQKVNKQGNSRFLNAMQGANLTDALLSSPILMSGDVEAGTAVGQSGDLGFGVDPNVDPELAMVLRMSMEEERQRQAAAAAAAPAVEAAPADVEEMSEEEMLRRAVQLSLQEAAASEPNPTSAHDTGANEEVDGGDEQRDEKARTHDDDAQHRENEEQ